MSSSVVAFGVQMIAGVVGEVAAGAAIHEHRLGTLTNTIVGIVGGLAGNGVYAEEIMDVIICQPRLGTSAQYSWGSFAMPALNRK